MDARGTFVVDTPADAARAAELRRVKLLATLVLAATFAIFIAARALLPVHPALGFVAAFAEAATIGGLADWYAVVAFARETNTSPRARTMSDWIWAASLSDLAEASLSMPAKNASAS